MDTKTEKLNLIADMIAFAIVDGKLHNKEYQFLWLVAEELKIEKEEFNQLFHQENKVETIKSEFERIQQFYRLALLMYCDGILHQTVTVKMIFLNPELISLSQKFDF